MSSEPHDNPPFTPRRVLSFDGTEIHYDVLDAPSAELVLLIPGFWRDRRHPAIRRIAHCIHGAGYRVAVVDLRGHGSSGGTFGFNLHEHHDVAAVIRDLLLVLPTVSSVALVGLSYGGAVAVSVAARHDLPVAGLVLISAVADYEMIRPRLPILTMHRHVALRQALRRPRFVWRARKAAKLRALDDIRQVHVPVCLVHAENDWLIGHHHALALHEAAHEPKELHLLAIDGPYHADRIFSVAYDTVEPIVTSFLQRYVPPSISQQ